MIFIIVAAIAFCGIVLGKYLLGKWINHLSLYCLIWGVLILLYEWKLLPFVDIVPIAWFYILSAFICFLMGILTIISTRELFSLPNKITDSQIDVELFSDGGKIMKLGIIIFGTLGLFAGVQHWLVLLDEFGSLTSIALNASKIYRMNNEGEIVGIIPYISAFSYTAVFLAAIYTAYRGKFTLITFYPFLGVIIKELASMGRAGVLFAIMEFVLAFILYRNLLKSDEKKQYKFSKKNAAIAISILIIFFISSITLVKVTRGSFETYRGASKELRNLEDNLLFSPSVYLYLSSHLGVLNQYLVSDKEIAEFGENTFLTYYGFLAKFNLVDKPEGFQRGYYIPMWTNTGTYIRELHADFGIAGPFIGPFLLGIIITWLWFKFYSSQSMYVFTFLVYFYLIIGFSFLVMVTRLPYWSISLLINIVFIYMAEQKLKGSFLPFSVIGKENE